MSTTQQQRVAHDPTLPALDTITASLVARQSRTDDDSLSVQDQIAQMRDYCAKQTPPWIVGGVYEEPDVSGRRPLDKRHGLKRAVEDVESGKSQVVLTAYFDRFVRSVATRAEVVQRVEHARGRVMTIDFGQTSDATAIEWLSGTLLAAIAEFYARQTGEKTAITKQRNLDRGVAPFPRITPAYVRNADGTLRQHETYGPLVADACRMRASGKSYTAIQRHLLASGLVVSQSGIESMLSSRLLIGEMHFGSFRPNLHAIANPVIDRATFRKMQSMRSTRGRNAKSPRLLARQSVLVCETCDSRMTVHPTSTNGTKYLYYRCGNRLCEKPASISCDVADDLVRDEAIRLSSEVVGHASAAADHEAARREREQIASRLDEAIRTFVGLADRPATREVLDALQADLDAAVEREHRLLALVTPDLTLTTIDSWDALTLDERRDVVRTVIATAVVSPGRGLGRIRIVERRALRS